AAPVPTPPSSMTRSTPPGTESAPPVTESTPPGTESTPPGTESSPSGTESTSPVTESAPPAPRTECPGRTALTGLTAPAEPTGPMRLTGRLAPGGPPPSCSERLLHLGFNQAQLPVLAPVQDMDVVGFRVGEHEEVVAEKLHLQDGLLDAHGLEGKPLGAHHLGQAVYRAVPLFLLVSSRPRRHLAQLGPLYAPAVQARLVL